MVAILFNQKLKQDYYQSENSMAPTADKIKVIWPNMSMLCNHNQKLERAGSGDEKKIRTIRKL